MEIPTAGPPPRPPTWLWPRFLTGTASSANPQVALPNLASGRPLLDLAFNDYLDVQLQVRPGPGNIQIYFGATNNYYGTSQQHDGFQRFRVSP